MKIPKFIKSYAISRKNYIYNFQFPNQRNGIDLELL